MIKMKFNYDQYATLAEKAKWFAYFHHGVTLHMYDDKTYFDGHLTRVANVAERYMHLIPEVAKDAVLAACWAHDTIEDTRVTYNDVKSIMGEQVAELVYAVTNEKGRNRMQRANHAYYQGIRDTLYATFVKLCDRIANIEAGIENGGKMVEMYRKENDHFEDELRYDNMLEMIYGNSAYEDMFEYMRNVVGIHVD
jgi:(p)ppGpp synthase/HD superfamily hydrolase